MDEIKVGTLVKSKYLFGRFKLYILIVGGIVFISIASIGVHLYLVDNTATDVCTLQKNLFLIKQAAALIPSGLASPQLNRITSQMSSINGSGRDPNCLYVYFKNSEFNGNLKQAQGYLNNYDKFYSSRTVMSKYFGYYGYLTPLALKSDLALYKKAQSYPSSINFGLRNPKP